MPRKSAAALSVSRPAVPGTRMPPPEGLTEREAELWRNVVDTKPAEWFAEDSAPVLKEYVRAVVTCDDLAAVVDKVLQSAYDPIGLKSALDMRDKEARRLASLATKLRLTQQSRYTPDKASTHDRRASGARPWQAAS